MTQTAPSMPPLQSAPRDLDPQLLDLIYDLPLGDADWEAVLGRLRRLVDAQSGVLMMQRPAVQDIAISVAGAHGRRTWRAYVDRFAAIDPFAGALLARSIPPGAAVTDDALLPRRALEATEFYQAFWRPEGIGPAAGAHRTERDGLTVHLVLPRLQDARPFAPADIACLQRHLRHLFRGARLAEALSRRGSGWDLDRFARAHKLTVAEVRLIEQMPRTRNLRAAAQCLGRSHHTVRAQARSIYVKTGVRSQVELINLLHRWGD